MSESPKSHLDDSGFSFAFQPIVDTHARAVYSHEALVRGVNQESAYQVIQRFSAEQMPRFDAACRAKAIAIATRIGLRGNLNLNFLPSAAIDTDLGLSSTIEAARRHSFPPQRIIVEATEGEMIKDHGKFAHAINEYRRAGLRIAIDDFGAGYSGLNFLAEFQPDIVKLDMALIRGIDWHGPRQAIVRAVFQVCGDLGIDVIAEGVETVDEFSWLTDLGVNLYQGYLFARPLFEGMPDIEIPDLRETRMATG